MCVRNKFQGDGKESKKKIVVDVMLHLRWHSRQRTYEREEERVSERVKERWDDVNKKIINVKI